MREVTTSCPGIYQGLPAYSCVTDQTGAAWICGIFKTLDFATEPDGDDSMPEVIGMIPH